MTMTIPALSGSHDLLLALLRVALLRMALPRVALRGNPEGGERHA